MYGYMQYSANKITHIPDNDNKYKHLAIKIPSNY